MKSQAKPKRRMSAGATESGGGEVGEGDAASGRRQYEARSHAGGRAPPHMAERAANGLPQMVRPQAKWWRTGVVRVAGVDEAGRGPLAGPVVAAACCMPAGVTIPGVDDSKALSADQREVAYAALTSHPDVEWGVAVVEHGVIDSINILQATMRAMESAVAALPHGAERVLVDGPRVPPGLQAVGEPLVGGDAKSYIIGAASIIAKARCPLSAVRAPVRLPAEGRQPRLPAGDARPHHDGPSCHVASLRLRPAQRLRHGGAHGGGAAARAMPHPPHHVSAGQGHAGGCGGGGAGRGGGGGGWRGGGCCQKEAAREEGGVASCCGGGRGGGGGAE